MWQFIQLIWTWCHDDSKTYCLSDELLLIFTQRFFLFFIVQAFKTQAHEPWQLKIVAWMPWVRLKSMIYNPKQDDNHLWHFHIRVFPPLPDLVVPFKNFKWLAFSHCFYWKPCPPTPWGITGMSELWIVSSTECDWYGRRLLSRLNFYLFIC